ncbi:MAG: 2-phosphosulfolactate phosphatase [Gemmatimonadetes bacterium]|nr:2-phosphosulfolactate phosphatase [Gemmatimonadota bacterium]
MSLSVSFSPVRTDADVAVVIDVLRFTTAAAIALVNGARSIIACATLEEARAHAPGVLLAGERNAVRPEGFDLGNSPLEFTKQAVQGRDIAWTTTNGTRALSEVLGSHPSSPLPPTSTPLSSLAPAPLPFQSDVVLASYVNLSAVVAFLAPRLEARSAVAIACSGREGSFALEDSACAGALVRRLRAALGDRLTMNDGARASACIDEAYGEDFARLFRDAQHGRFLRDHGFGADLDACGALDAAPVVPRWRDGRFVAG